MHMLHHFVFGVGSGDCQHFRVNLLDEIAATISGLGTQAAGDDYFAILCECFTNRIQRLFHCRINEPTSVHDDKIRTRIVGRDIVALGA